MAHVETHLDSESSGFPKPDSFPHLAEKREQISALLREHRGQAIAVRLSDGQFVDSAPSKTSLHANILAALANDSSQLRMLGIESLDDLVLLAASD